MLKIDDEMLWAVDWLTKGFCTSSLAARPMFVSPEKESPKSTDAGNLPLSFSSGGRLTAKVDNSLKTPAVTRTLSENDTIGVWPGTLPTINELPSIERAFFANEGFPVEVVLVPTIRLIIVVDWFAVDISTVGLFKVPVRTFNVELYTKGRDVLGTRLKSLVNELNDEI